MSDDKDADIIIDYDKRALGKDATLGFYITQFIFALILLVYYARTLFKTRNLQTVSKGIHPLVVILSILNIITCIYAFIDVGKAKEEVVVEETEETEE